MSPRRSIVFIVLVVFLSLFGAEAFAQYNKGAGSNAPARAKKSVAKKDSSGELLLDDRGKVQYEEVLEEVDRDQFGNAVGNQHDLAVDGAFEGQTIVVLQFYVEPNFDFSLPRNAVEEKGFSVYRYINQAPSAGELKESLDKACQLWIISGSSRHLNEEHLEVIKAFYEAGHGLYIWGDNDPYYADANYVGEALFGVTMLGDLPGDKTVMVQSEKGSGAGIISNHLLSTGLENMYEGITIATVQENQTLTPLIYGSANNQVAAFYDADGRRAIFDGGFTRLYYKWDTAGTPRYIKNAAAWLANYEKFGEEIVAASHRD